MRYHGQMSVQIGILVAFTQIIPEYQVQVLGVLRARVKVTAFPCVPLLLISPIIDPTYGLPRNLNDFVHCWIPMPLDLDPVRMVR